MRKRLVMTVVACMMLSLAGCGNKDNTSEAGTEEVAVVTTEESTTEVTEERTEQNTETVQDVTINSAVDILNTVWGSYEETEKFPVGGGDSANLNFEGPAAFDATNAEELDVTLGFPTAQAEKIDDAAKLLGTQELVITGELADQIGSYDAVEIVNQLKLILDETKNMSDEELLAQIKSIAEAYNVNLVESQYQQLIDLCRAFEKMDSDELKEKVEYVQETAKKLADAQEKVSGITETIKNVVEKVSGFVDKILNIFNKNK